MSRSKDLTARRPSAKAAKRTSKLITQWLKGNANGDIVRVELGTYYGADIVIARIWRPHPGGHDQPFRNAITLGIEHPPNLVKA
jgi:hypothetical protein